MHKFTGFYLISGASTETCIFTLISRGRSLALCLLGRDLIYIGFYWAPRTIIMDRLVRPFPSLSLPWPWNQNYHNFPPFNNLYKKYYSHGINLYCVVDFYPPLNRRDVGGEDNRNYSRRLYYSNGTMRKSKQYYYKSTQHDQIAWLFVPRYYTGRDSTIGVVLRLFDLANW